MEKSIEMRMAYINKYSKDVFFENKEKIEYVGKIFKNKYFQFFHNPDNTLEIFKKVKKIFDKDKKKYSKKEIEKYMENSLKDPTMGIKQTDIEKEFDKRK